MKTDAPVIEYRCPKCGALLLKAALMPGSQIEIMCVSSACRKNKRVVVIEVPQKAA